jgi:hypothetical protein
MGVNGGHMRFLQVTGKRVQRAGSPPAVEQGLTRTGRHLDSGKAWPRSVGLTSPSPICASGGTYHVHITFMSGTVEKRTPDRMQRAWDHLGAVR